jgi:SNF family Na+-dependent transporter
MELTAAVAILVAVVAPFVIALITRPDWSPDKKRTTAIIVAVVLGVIVAVATGRIAQIPATIQSWVAQGVIVVGIIVSLAQGFYQALKGAVSTVEAATSPAPVPQHAVEDATATPSITAGNDQLVHDPGNGTDPTTTPLV